MPLPKRSIQPAYVTRSIHQQGESFDLLTVTNTSLTNIIRQISSLSRHAEDLFGELAQEAGGIADRTKALQARIDQLSMKITHWECTVEKVHSTDVMRKKTYKSTKLFDQQRLTRDTRPAHVQEAYSLCDKTPPLNKLNVYRDDGQDGLKFYTDPNYFFQLWHQEMLKETERVMHDKGKKLHCPRKQDANGGTSGSADKKSAPAPHNKHEKQRQIAIGHGETLIPNNVIYHTPDQVVNEESGYGDTIGAYEVVPPRPDTIDSHRNYPPSQEEGMYDTISLQYLCTRNVAGQNTPAYASDTNGMCPTQHSQMLNQQVLQQNQKQINNQQVQANHGHVDNSIPAGLKCAPGTPSRKLSRRLQPPPVPLRSDGTSNTSTRGHRIFISRTALPLPPPIPDRSMTSLSQVMNSNDLPPPPPNEENDEPVQQQQAISNGTKLPQTNCVLMDGRVVNSHVIGSKKILPPYIDPCGVLMQEIRNKKWTLKKVKKTEQNEKTSNKDPKIECNAGYDVASILKRRPAIKISESEESDTDNGCDSNEWILMGTLQDP